MESNLNINAYTDISRFGAMRAAAQRDGEGAFRQVAKEFEALFIELMLKTAREAGPKGGLFDSRELEIYRQMFDSQIALAMAERGGLGFEQALRNQLGISEPTEPTNTDRPQADLPQAESIPERIGITSSVAPSPEHLTSGLTSTPGAVSHQWRTQIPPPSHQDSDDGSSEPQQSAANSEVKPLAAVLNSSVVSRDKAGAQLEFVNKLYPHAVKAAGELNTTPSVLIAQAALETGWGKHMITQGDGRSSNNYFAIKAHKNWQGETAKVSTLEYFGGAPVNVRAAFRAYPNIDSAFRDYVDFVRDNPRYQDALAANGNADRYANALANAGYATDPRYANKIEKLNTRVLNLLNQAAVSSEFEQAKVQ